MGRKKRRKKAIFGDFIITVRDRYGNAKIIEWYEKSIVEAGKKLLEFGKMFDGVSNGRKNKSKQTPRAKKR